MIDVLLMLGIVTGLCTILNEFKQNYKPRRRKYAERSPSIRCAQQINFWRANLG